MYRFLIRRLLGLVATLFVAVTLVFFTLQIIPGDPAEAALSQSTATEDTLERRRQALGLDQPLHIRYGRYLLGILQADLGISWASGQPVSFLIGQQLPATLTLASGGMLFGGTLGFMMGINAGASVRSKSWVGGASRYLSGLFLALPVMFSGTVLIWVFAVLLDWLPATGQGGILHLILPIFVLGLSVSGGIARVVDAALADVLREPFMRTALAKGLSWRQALFRHGLRVGLLPVFDVLALQFAYLLGGTVVIETLFVRQGIGRLMLMAVLDKDIPLVQGVVLLTAFVYSILNFFADLAHGWLDPRIRFDV